MSNLMTIEELQELLSIRRDTVERMIARGDILAYKVGGAVRIDRRSIDEYLARRVMGQGVKHRA